MICERCGNKLTGKQTRWCSKKCSELGLKSEFRKRHRKKINEYNRDWRRAKNGGDRPLKHPSKLREDQCLNCGSTDDLQLAHIKPLAVGGTHKYVITLCRNHHAQFDNLLREFWGQPPFPYH